MKNSFGNGISITLFGESHGPEIGAVIDGLAPGIPIIEEKISDALSLRKPYGKISTKRVEADKFRIISGVFNGYTTGTPVTILIPNENTKSGDYKQFTDTPRPSHADYTAECKYHGFQDYRGGGHFSGRITAPLVAAGAIIATALSEKGIHIGTHIKLLQGIRDREICDQSDVMALKTKLFPVLDPDAADKMENAISAAGSRGDSLGGVLETYVFGMPAGVGEPFFDSVESLISHGLFSIPGIKGVEFGLGFGFAEKCGSAANDAFEVKDGKILTKTNNNGGINGGITNGMPIVFRCAVRPTPSIFMEQQTVSLSAMENRSLVINGRHDPAIIHRVRAVVDAITAITLADLLTVRFGTDYLR